MIYLSLGSNLGEREQNLEHALAAMEAEQIHIAARSSFYETEPQDLVEQPWFLNICVACETRYFPIQLLHILQRIELDQGRSRRVVPKGPRLIDIDILLYKSAVIETPQLMLPHPRMLERRFVLEPLLEIAPELRHPGTGKPLRDYLTKIRGQKVVLQHRPGRE
jgi:2-amino-4-hydroxy-6-hydroxymethyldihydropteridine diphosphokinase